jgi:flagellar P-ring protein precursor FlgI
MLLLTRATSVRLLLLLLAALLLGLAALPADAQSASGNVRIKELVVLEGARPLQLVGYGIVVGLDRTGDRASGRRGAPYTVQSIANMLQRFGIAVDPTVLGTRNAAAVMVTATIDPFSGPGAAVDVTLSSLGDARSLSGGVLLQTPLLDPTGMLGGAPFVMAQGPVSTGSASAGGSGGSVQVNHGNTGRVPGGGLIVQSPPIQIEGQTMGLVLRQPDFTAAARIAEAVNERFTDAANVVHAGLVRVEVPVAMGGISEAMAALEGVRVEIDAPARFVINERTGTIVAGGNVRISEVMITYGSLIVSTQNTPFVSQPNALAQGQTVVGEVETATLEQEQARSVVLQPNTDVTALAAALNELGLTPRDVISIFQAIDQAGALQGELVIL